MFEQRQAKDFEQIGEPTMRALKEAGLLDIPSFYLKLGEVSARYVYSDKEGAPLIVVHRFDNSDNSDDSRSKEFRPFNVLTHKWKAPEVRPLYRLDLLAETEGPVVLVEGEKCADALNDLGILATTAYGGSNGVGKTDFTPLRGRDVIIWPDADGPGFKYAQAAFTTLREIGAASVRVVPVQVATLPNVGETASPTYTLPIPRDGKTLTYTLGKGWDAADAIAEGDDALWPDSVIDTAIPYEDWAVPLEETEASKGNVPLVDTAPQSNVTPLRNVTKDGRRTVDLFGGDTRDATLGNVKWGEPDMSVLNPRRKPPAFPTELFGPFWSKWITAKAESCSAPVDYVGATLLTSTSALVGCSRLISPWEGWSEPPVLWMALVGSPSSGKSPALETVLGTLSKIEQDGAGAVKDKLRQFEADLLAAQCVRQDWEKAVKAASNAGDPIPPMPIAAQEPTKPERPRLVVSDTTPEALARLLAHQPKGLLVKRDELAGWVGSFNRYAGGSGGDRAFWIEAFGARPYVIDRARNGGESVTIPNLAASVIGGIQPDKLNSLLLGGDDDGFTARMLFCWPDPVPFDRPTGGMDSYESEKALRWLNSLSLVPNPSGSPEPALVTLADDAAALFVPWVKEHTANEPDGALASWWGKMRGVCLRLALCLEYLSIAATTKQETFTISAWAIEAATVLIDQYFKPMAARTYGDAGLPQSERNAAVLAKWIMKNKPDRINVREMQRGAKQPGLRKAAEIKEAIEVLVEAGWLRADPTREGGTVGKRSGDYEVNPEVTNG